MAVNGIFFNNKKLIIITIFFVILFIFFTGKSESASLQELKKDVIFYSGKLSTLDKDVFLLEDKVLFIYQDFTLESDYLFLDFKNGHIKAKGNVRAINGDTQILANELEFDIVLESVKIKGVLINLNNLIKFEAKEVFLIKKYISIDGFKFRDEDKKLPFSYTILLDKLNIFPFPGNKYFFLQIKDVNGGIFNRDKLSPISVPGYEFYLRNPTLPKNYLYKKRLRGFADPGDFFFRVGADSYRGPWASATISYFGTDYSAGFFTAEYGLFSNIELSVYQDLTDNKGNLIQFSSSLRQYDRFLQRANLDGNLSFIHDWENDTFLAQVSLNQTFGPLIIHRLPSVVWNSVFRKENYTGLQYRYDFDVTRYITIEQNNKTTDIARLRLLGDINSPKFYLTPKINLQALSEGVYVNYLNNSVQAALVGQIQMNHSLFDSLDYTIRYRQRYVWGKSPLTFENLTNNQLVGLQVNWWVNSFIELAGFTEFSIPHRQFASINLLANYTTDYYSISLLADLLNFSVSSNFKFLNF